MKTFDHLFVLGRPASGKSEFLDFMGKLSDAERAEAYHIGKMKTVDDFVWLWEKFEEDDLWEKAGCPRMYSLRYDGNYGLDPKAEKLYDLMLARFNHEVATRYLTRPAFYNDGTLIIEFARGGKQGYAYSLPRLSKEILERAAILYVKVSFDESWRRNVARYEEKQKHSILAHMVPRQTMENFYLNDDWDTYTVQKGDGYLTVNKVKVPFFTMPNEPELKERGPLADRYGPALTRLMELYEKK